MVAEVLLCMLLLKQDSWLVQAAVPYTAKQIVAYVEWPTELGQHVVSRLPKVSRYEQTGCAHWHGSVHSRPHHIGYLRHILHLPHIDRALASHGSSV